MRGWHGWQIFLLAALAFSCGGKTRVASSDRAESGGSAMAGGESSSTGGAAPTGGGDGAGGNEEVDSFQPAFDHPQLAPLSDSESALSTASGDELFELATQIGWARGYAVCLCAPGNEDWNPDDEALDGCAQAEAWPRGLTTRDMERRCVQEQSVHIPQFEEILRCYAQRMAREGRLFAACEGDVWEDFSEIVPAESCRDVPESEYASALLGSTLHGPEPSCVNVFYCDDDTVHYDGRCNRERDCPDSADEVGCGWVDCAGELRPARELCRNPVCAPAAEAGLCEPDPDSSRGTSEFSCTEVPFEGNICDGIPECPNGEDELQGLTDVRCLNGD